MTRDYLSLLPPLGPLVLISGKGGVGKSYVSSCLASAFSGRGERVAVVRFTNDGALGRESGAGCTEVRLNPVQALREQAARIIGSPTLARLVIDQRAIRSVLDIVPGINEVALLLSVQQLTAEYDRVVVDLPATGHGGSWLQAPRTLLGVVDGGRAATLTHALAKDLENPRRTSVVLVTTPEPFVLLEAERLSRTLATKAGLATTAVVVNRVPTAFDEESRRAAWSLGASNHPAAADAARLANVLSERQVTSARAESVTNHFGVDVPVIEMPETVMKSKPLTAAAA